MNNSGRCAASVPLTGLAFIGADPSGSKVLACPRRVGRKDTELKKKLEQKAKSLDLRASRYKVRYIKVGK